MIRLMGFAFLSVSIVLASTPEITFENSNFTLNTPIDNTKKNKFYNYNRFRTTISLYEDNWFFTSIADVENYLGKKMINSSSYLTNKNTNADTPFATQTSTTNYGDGEYKAKLYRMYGGYVDDKNRVSLGLQKISMGVGRIWNPTDLFNPKNPMALEPDEVYGAFSLLYTYALSDLSQITTVVAEQENHNLKYVGRIKGYVGFADIGLNLISSNDASMIGYEIESELFETGIAMRSEGGWFEDKILKEEFFQGVIGADYTFANSFTLAVESLYSSQKFSKTQLSSTDLLNSPISNNLMKSKNYLGATLGYEFTPLLYGNLTTIMNSDDESFYIAPSLSYSLDDDMSLLFGAMVYDGIEKSEFGNLGETYYLNFKVTF